MTSEQKEELPDARYNTEKRILVVDDEPFNLKSIEIMLQLAIKSLDKD